MYIKIFKTLEQLFINIPLFLHTEINIKFQYNKNFTIFLQQLEMDL